MEIHFTSEAGRPQFIITPETVSDFAVLKHFVDWKQNFPDDDFLITSSSFRNGTCLNATVGHRKKLDIKYLKTEDEIIQPEAIERTCRDDYPGTKTLS